MLHVLLHVHPFHPHFHFFCCRWWRGLLGMIILSNPRIWDILFSAQEQLTKIQNWWRNSVICWRRCLFSTQTSEWPCQRHWTTHSFREGDAVMPVIGVYIVACLDMKLSSAYVESRKLFIILEFSASIGWTNKRLFFSFYISSYWSQTLCVVALLVARSRQSINGAWRGWASAVVSGRYPQSIKLCTFVRQHAQSVFLSICFWNRTL